MIRTLRPPSWLLHVDMAAVPQRTLNWLYGVLTRDHHDSRQTYQDPNRTYYDVANVLAQYPSLSPRTDVYTYETGFSALLLLLTGTLPVTFRGTVYKFPIALWIPNTYPLEPPMVYVTPTPDMAVRVGQHVTLEGRVYHHYLAHWIETWDRSSLVDFLLILREVFAKEPPVKNKQQPQVSQRAPPSQPTQAPPPLPPLPPELGSSIPRPPATPQPVPPQAAGQVLPPPPPPKPGQVVSVEQQQQQRSGQASPAGRYDSPPPLPPLPPKEQDLRRQSFQPHAGFGGPATDRPSPYRPERDAARRLSHPPQQYAIQSTPTYTSGPAYAPSGTGIGARSPPLPVGSRGLQQQHEPLPVQQQGPAHPPGWSLSDPRYQQQQPPPQAVAIPPPHPRQPPQPQPQPAPNPKAQTPDLLTSPFELDLPSFTPTGPAPPIPPNPQKDALLHAVSKTLAETVQANVAQSESAAHALLAQSESLHAAIASLQGEIASLNALNSTLQSNSATLSQSLHRADAVIASAQSTSVDPADSRLPPIDDVLVAPTVVGKQLYDLVADERGIQQAIYALQSALVKGFVGVDTWSRHTRGLAREAFLKRALIRKIGRGMGLEES